MNTLNRLQFRSWLCHNMWQGNIVGIAGSVTDCPIASYIKTLLTDSNVSAHHEGIELEFKESLFIYDAMSTPSWAKQFMDVVDGTDNDLMYMVNNNKPVTAANALRILDSIP